MSKRANLDTQLQKMHFILLKQLTKFSLYEKFSPIFIRVGKRNNFLMSLKCMGKFTFISSSHDITIL